MIITSMKINKVIVKYWLEPQQSNNLPTANPASLPLLARYTRRPPYCKYTPLRVAAAQAKTLLVDMDNRKVAFILIIYTGSLDPHRPGGVPSDLLSARRSLYFILMCEV